jgi:hypothetical protein
MRFFLEQYEKLIAKKNEIMLLTINEFSFFKIKTIHSSQDILRSGQSVLVYHIKQNQ